MNKKLYQRVLDVYCGASGDLWDEGSEWATAEVLSRVIPALQKIFDPNNLYTFAWKDYNIREFDTVSSATNHIEKVLRMINYEFKEVCMNRTLERWNSFKRLLLVLFSILMWIVSIFFSYIGFKSGARSEWYFGLFALILSGTITTMELHLNSQTFDFDNLNVGRVILILSGLICYAYGIWTNIVGVSIMMVGNADLTTVGWQQQVVPIIFGLLLEILPEPMFVEFLRSNASTPTKSTQKPVQYNVPKPTTNFPSEFRQKYSSETYRPVKR